MDGTEAFNRSQKKKEYEALRIWRLENDMKCP